MYWKLSCYSDDTSECLTYICFFSLNTEDLSLALASQRESEFLKITIPYYN